MTELNLTPSDVHALRAMGVSTGPAERRAPDTLAVLLREKLDVVTFTYEREIGRILDERNMWRGRWEKTYGLLMALVAGVIWISFGLWMGWV